MDDIQKTTKDLVNAAKALPFADLIGGPLVACVEAQHQAAIATSKFIETVGIDTKSGEVALIHFTFLQEGQKRRMSVPLLSIVPIPYIQINNIKLNFRADMSLDSENNFVAKFASQAGNASSTTESTGNSTMKLGNHLDVEIQAIGTSMPAGLGKVLDVFANNCMRIEDVTMKNYTIDLDKLGMQLGASVTVDEGGWRGKQVYQRYNESTTGTELGYLPDGTPIKQEVTVECTETMPLELDKVSASHFNSYIYTKKIVDDVIYVKYEIDPSKMYHVEKTGYDGNVDVFIDGALFKETNVYSNLKANQISISNTPGYDCDLSVDGYAIKLNFKVDPDCLYKLAEATGYPADGKVAVTIDGEPFSEEKPYVDLVPNQVKSTAFDGYVATVSITNRTIKITYRQQKPPATGSNKYTIEYNAIGKSLKYNTVKIDGKDYKKDSKYNSLQASQVTSDVEGYITTIYIEGTVIHVDYEPDSRYLYTESITGTAEKVTLKVNGTTFSRQTPYVGLKAEQITLSPKISGYKGLVQVVGNEIKVAYDIDPDCLYEVEWKDLPTGASPQLYIDKKAFDKEAPYPNLQASRVSLAEPIKGYTSTIQITKANVIEVTFKKDPNCFYNSLEVIGIDPSETTINVDGVPFNSDKAYPNLTADRVEAQSKPGMLPVVTIDSKKHVITVNYTTDPTTIYKLSITGVAVAPTVLYDGRPFDETKSYLGLSLDQLQIIGEPVGYNCTKTIDTKDPNNKVIRIAYSIKPECKYTLKITGNPSSPAAEVKIKEGSSYNLFNENQPYVGLSASMIQATAIPGFLCNVSLVGQVIQVKYTDDPACFFSLSVTGNPGTVNVTVKGKAYSKTEKYIGIGSDDIKATAFPGYVCTPYITGNTITVKYAKDSTSWFASASTNMSEAVGKIKVNGVLFNANTPYPNLTTDKVTAPAILGYSATVQFIGSGPSKYIYVGYRRIAKYFYTVNVTNSSGRTATVSIDGKAYDANQAYDGTMSSSRITATSIPGYIYKVSITNQTIKVEYLIDYSSKAKTQITQIFKNLGVTATFNTSTYTYGGYWIASKKTLVEIVNVYDIPLSASKASDRYTKSNALGTSTILMFTDKQVVENSQGVEMWLADYMGIYSVTANAKKCAVGMYAQSYADDFYKLNHPLGTIKADIHYACVETGVGFKGMMSFNRLGNNRFELVRFCHQGKCNAPEAFKIILQQLKKAYNYTEVIANCGLELAVTSTLTSLGFKIPSASSVPDKDYLLGKRTFSLTT